MFIFGRWTSNLLVGQVLRNAGMVDVAAYLADQRDEPALRAPTGVHGGVRVDQAHVTAALVPAISDYQRIDPAGHSDHYGIVCTLQLDRIDHDALRPYT